MPHEETSLIVGLGWNLPLAYICLLKSDNSVKDSAKQNQWRLGSSEVNHAWINLLHFHSAAFSQEKCTRVAITMENRIFVRGKVGEI